MDINTWGGTFIVIKKEFQKMIPSASAEIKCKVHHLSWLILKLLRGMDDQADRALAHVFQCRESCVTAKPSRACQIRFRIMHCQSQALLQLLLGMIYVYRVLRVPGHFKELQLLTRVAPSVVILCRACLKVCFQCIKKPRGATQTNVLEEKAMDSFVLLG